MDTVKLECKGFHTIDELNKVYAWSMTSLATGQCPEAQLEVTNGALASPRRLGLALRKLQVQALCQ